MTVNLSIEVQTYNDDLQSSTVDSVVSIIDSFIGDAGAARVSSLPTKRKVWTVNRSPHIFKKSREQFEQRKYKTRISCVCNSLDSSFDLLNVLYSQEYLGAGLKAHLEFSSAVPSYN